MENYWELDLTTTANIILVWWPWMTIWGDLWVMQISLLYCLFLFLYSSNVYYVLLYLFFQLFFFGLFLGLIQMELFTGFLWILELTVIFISVLLLFYLNYTGESKKKKNKNYFYYYFGFFFLIFFNYDYPGEFEGYIPRELNIYDFWEDYYEANHNFVMNDFMGLLIGYYSINSFELVLIGNILLIGSVACVNLFRSNQLKNIPKYATLLKIFNFFVDFVDYVFMRKQTLNKQTARSVSTKIFKKK